MADEEQVKPQNPDAAAQSEPTPAEQQPAPPPATGKDPVKRWTVIILIVCAALLVWYLRSDRVTPMSSQARVHALVVPIAPQISGTVSSVSVSNNQLVEPGQELFRIDAESYSYAVKTAEAALQQAYQGQGAAQANVD